MSISLDDDDDNDSNKENNNENNNKNNNVPSSTINTTTTTTTITTTTTTPAPTDWQHIQILLERNVRNDRMKPRLWFARVFCVGLLLMLYTIGIAFNYDNAEAGELIQMNDDQDPIRMFPQGEEWVFPTQRVRVSGNNRTIVERIGRELNDILFSTEVLVEDVNATTPPLSSLTTYTDFCRNVTTPKISSSDEVCIFLEDRSKNQQQQQKQTMHILYPGEEGATPFAPELAGIQYAVYQAFWNSFDNNNNNNNNNNTAFAFLPSQRMLQQYQKTPELIQSEELVNQTNVALLVTPGLLHCIATAIMVMFIMALPHTEHVNGVVRSFVLVGVKLRTYMISWWIYSGILNGMLTAIMLACISVYYNLLPQSNWFLLFLSHYLGILGLVAMYVLFSQIIPQQELAQGTPFLGAFASIGAVLPCLIMIDDNPATDPILYLLTTISPFCGILQYYAVYMTYDSTGVGTGIQWGNGTVSESGLLGVYMAQMACIVIWLGCILVFSSLRRSAPKIQQQQQDDNNDNNKNDSNFESLPPGSNVLLQVRGLSHTYVPGCCKSICMSKTAAEKPTEVLKGLDLDICRGEVFGYLGHNGAGKSTSVKLLSAEEVIQEGDITYNLNDGGTAPAQMSNPRDLDRIRGKIGVCPQHNDSLQDNLTCRETLRLFAQLKGRIPKRDATQSDQDAIGEEIERRLNDIAFTSAGDADKPIGTYSGGMKRKVSIALALLGSPECVFLDEPTAGMDPYNRRQIWDMIIAAKKGRSIILTTHFLDEADVLSDRIGILKDGKLITCGTSLFLKHHFGVGYTLRFDADHPIDIRDIVPTAEELPSEMPGRHYEWRLEHGSEPDFPRVLQTLGQSGATDISLDLTTLEEVFLQTGKEDEDQQEEEKQEQHEDSSDDNNEEEENDPESSGTSSAVDNLRQIWKPMGTITPLSFWKKFLLVQNFMMLNAWKMKGTIILNIAQPLAYIIAGFICISLVDVPEKGELVIPFAIPLGMDLAVPGPMQFFGVPNITDDNMVENSPIFPLIPTEAPETLQDYFADPNLPIFGGFFDTNSTLQYNPETSPFALQIALHAMAQVIAAMNKGIADVSTTLQQLPYISESPFRVDLLLLPLCMGFGFNGMAFSVLDVLLLKGDGIIALFKVAGITEWSAYLGVMCYKFTTSFTPFFILVVVLSIALEVVLMGNAGRWLATMLFMLCYAYSTTPIGLILGKRFIHSDFKSVANWFPGVYMTFVSLPYIAWVSALQALPESRDLILVIGDILCLIPQVAFQRGLGAVIEVSTKFDDENLTWATVWSWESRIWFTICIMLGMGTLEWAYLHHLTTSRPAPTKISENDPVDATDPINVSANPETEAEHKKSLEDDDGINARELVKVFRVPDPDQEKSMSMKKKKKDTILKRTVKGVSFGIRKNEIFALLGPNGAGKSVTMGMLASEHTPEHGMVALQGQISDKETKSTDHLYAQCNVAYCPQFDALFPRMTVLQHLQFYAKIRGLEWEDKTTQEHIRAIVHLLGLNKHKSKAAKDLSGGYKRRLSLGLAMIGYPKVLMVDEATTGMDPGARHLVWDVLKPQVQHEDYDLPAILLSSHYMDECETLGDTIAIMIDGEIVTVGSLQYLQRKYCTSYFIEISLEVGDIGAGTDGEAKAIIETSRTDAVLDAFSQVGMEATVYESLPYRFKLQLPFQKDGLAQHQQLADIFDLLEREKKTLGIKFYSVEQMNLEKIFIDLSRKQFEGEEQALPSQESRVSLMASLGPSSRLQEAPR